MLKSTSSKSTSLNSRSITELSKSSSKKDPSQRKLDVHLYKQEVKPSERMLRKAFLKTMVLLHDSLQERQILMRKIAVERALAECGDLVYL
jgi:hypothetical protein